MNKLIKNQEDMDMLIRMMEENSNDRKTWRYLFKKYPILRREYVTVYKSQDKGLVYIPSIRLEITLGL